MATLTRPRRIVAAVAVAGAALLVTTGVAMADPNEVDDGGHHGGHTNSHLDQHSQGDDNDCNFKYTRTGSRSHRFDGDNDDCPTLNPRVNSPNPAYDHTPGAGDFPSLPF